MHAPLFLAKILEKKRLTFIGLLGIITLSIHGDLGPFITPNNPAINQEYDVIIIGSGIGGLTIGALLAHTDYHVLILEKEPIVGGFCRPWVEQGFTFNMGATEVTGLDRNGPLTYVLRYLGSKASEHFSLHKKRFLISNESIDVENSPEALIEQLVSRFPHESAAVRNFFETAQEMYEICYGSHARRFGIPLNPTQVFFADGFLATLAYCFSHWGITSWLSESFTEKLTKSFHDQKLITFFEGLSHAVGLNPVKTPALTGLFAILAPLMHGCYYPQGGCAGYAEYLKKSIESDGSVVLTTMPVERVIVHNGTVRGVKVGNTIFKANIVISNTNPYTTFTTFVDQRELDSPTKNLLATPQWTTSAVLVSFGIKGVVEGPSLISDGDEKIHLSLNSARDPLAAPPGCSSITVAFSYPYEKVPHETDTYHAWREEMIQKAWRTAQKHFTGLTDQPLVSSIITPIDLEHQVNMPYGAAYGINSVSSDKITQKQDITTSIKGLYVVSASVLFGGGVEAITMTALTCFHEITGWKRELY